MEFTGNIFCLSAAQNMDAQTNMQRKLNKKENNEGKNATFQQPIRVLCD